MYRFGEFDVSRVRRILANDTSAEPAPLPGKPPALCPGCPHRATFELLKKLDCIVSGDIGCYTLGALPPFEAMDSQLCMGASIGIGLGMRHVLPEAEARRVVSVIGDSTFVHGGHHGLGGNDLQSAANWPRAGDPRQRHHGHDGPARASRHGTHLGRPADRPGSVRGFGPLVGRGQRSGARSGGQRANNSSKACRTALASNEMSVFIVRRPCLLAMAKHKKGRGERGEGRVAKAECSEARVADSVYHADIRNPQIPKSLILISNSPPP